MGRRWVTHGSPNGSPNSLTNGFTLTDGRTDGRYGRLQDQPEKSQSDTAAGPVDYIEFPASTDEWLSSDDAFALFLATVKPADLNPYEWDVYQWHRMRRTSK